MLLQLIHKKGKALVLSEYGVGGGLSQSGDVPAVTADEAASLPFFGIFGSYNPVTGVHMLRRHEAPCQLL